MREMDRKREREMEGGRKGERKRETERERERERTRVTTCILHSYKLKMTQTENYTKSRSLDKLQNAPKACSRRNQANQVISGYQWFHLHKCSFTLVLQLQVSKMFRYLSVEVN